jgi:hypothetical protein
MRCAQSQAHFSAPAAGAVLQPGVAVPQQGVDLRRRGAVAIAEAAVQCDVRWRRLQLC